MSQPPPLAVNPDILVRSLPSQVQVQVSLCTEDGSSCLSPSVGHWTVTHAPNTSNESRISFPTVYETAIKVSRMVIPWQGETYNTFYIQANFFSLTPSGYHQPRCCSDYMERLTLHDFLGSSKAVKFDPWETSTKQIVLAPIPPKPPAQSVITPTGLDSSNDGL